MQVREGSAGCLATRRSRAICRVSPTVSGCARRACSRSFKTLCERHEETELGFRFFVNADPEVLSTMGEFLALERLCCPFLEFHLEVSSSDLAALHIFGRPGAKAIIAAGFLPDDNS